MFFVLTFFTFSRYNIADIMKRLPSEKALMNRKDKRRGFFTLYRIAFIRHTAYDACGTMQHMKYCKTIRNTLVWIFMLSMIIYPLYMKQGFVHLATAKKEYYYIACCILLIPALVLSAVMYLMQTDRKSTPLKLLVTDYFAVAYGLVLLISTMGSPYQDTAINGSSGWYMGMITQLLFLLTYFMISRSIPFNINWLFGLFGAAFIIYILCVFARFHVAPFNLYAGRDEDFWNAFIPTIGQKNWYACFMAIVFPMELGYFLICQKKRQDAFLIPLLFVSTMAMVMQDSDSIYVGMLFVLLFLFEMFCNDLAGLKRYFFMLTITFLAMQTLGVIQIINAQRMVKLSKTVTTVCQSTTFRISGIVILIIWLALEIFAARLDHEKLMRVNRFIHIFKWVLMVLAALTIVGLILMIILVTNFSDRIDFGSLSDSKYFMFNDAWGTWRGMNWSIAVTSYGELNFWQKLFGIGPDCYYPYVNAFHADFTSRWSSAICNAHNEFLTALVNTGLLGAISYYGLFVSLIWETYRQKKKKPVLLALTAGIVGFLFNNLFSFMNIISTPLLFTVAGCVSVIARQEE